MAEELILTQGLSREERYQELLPQIKAVIEGETDPIANQANVAAMADAGLYVVDRRAFDDGKQKYAGFYADR